MENQIFSAYLAIDFFLPFLSNIFFLFLFNSVPLMKPYDKSHMVPGIGYTGPDIRNWISGIGYPKLNIRDRISGI